MFKTILVAEDYEDARGFMKLLLEGYGYRVLEATNGEQALDLFKLMHPDLILMDLSMPIMDGLTATRIIRNLETSTHIPIIAVTAFGNRFLEQAIAAGCDYLIDKPINFELIEPLLNQYLGI